MKGGQINEERWIACKVRKKAILDSIDNLSYATKYGNIYMKFTTSGNNNIQVSFVADSNEQTLSNTNIVEQISCEITYDINLKNSNYRPKNGSSFANVAFGVLVVAIVAAIAGALSSVTAAAAAAAAILIWLGTSLNIIDKK